MRPALPGIAILIMILPLFLTAALYRPHPVFACYQLSLLLAIL
jgi:hypothetical protein